MKRMLAMFLGICLLASGCSGSGSEEAIEKYGSDTLIRSIIGELYRG